MAPPTSAAVARADQDRAEPKQRYAPSPMTWRALAVAMMATALPTLTAAQAADGLDGTFWRVTGFADGPSRLAGDIKFEAGQVSGATSCNFFGGTYTIGPDDRLTIKLGRMTRRGCTGEAAEAERLFIDAMEKTAGFARDSNTLRLSALDKSILAHLTTAPVHALVGTRQKIVSYLHKGGLYSVAPGSEPWLHLRDGRLEGSTGCTPLAGTYVDTGTSLSITLEAAIAPPADCSEPSLARQDTAIRAALPLAGTFDSNRNLIRLLQPDGETAVMWLTPEEANP
ncbi:MAG: META domain-containing protein [Hyphomicrobiaceae bacterium]|nr:META domain-containing protein [Hyphomicrobiaceae bacterium]